MEYTLKPVTVNALQFNGSNFNEIEWFTNGEILVSLKGIIKLKLPNEASLLISEGDYIVKSEAGDISSSPASDFESKYDPVN